MNALNKLGRCLGLRLVWRFGLRLSLGFRLRLELGLGLSFVRPGLRFRLAVGPTFPKLLLRLLPILNGCSTIGRSMLVKFVGSPGDLRSQIRWCLDVGFRVNLGLRFGCFCLGSRRRRSLYFRLRLIRSVFNLRLFRLGFRRRRGFFFRLRLVGFRFGLRKSDPWRRLSLVGVHMVQDSISCL